MISRNSLVVHAQKLGSITGYIEVLRGVLTASDLVLGIPFLTPYNTVGCYTQTPQHHLIP